ncbi:MAG: biopolymer transporter ExbD [Geminicoccaceae bacterium]|nr:biopolymer transporter ExbD [Geminicoccaceae bacterium]
MRTGRRRYPALPPRRTGEPTLPLINVVFLLLIFVLLTSAIEIPGPLTVDLAESRSAEGADPGHPLLFASADEMASRTAILSREALRAWVEENRPQTVVLHADRNLTASRLFTLVEDLRRLGVETVELAVTRQ